MMSRYTWLSLAALLAIPAFSSAQVETKKVFLRSLSREGKRVFITTETAGMGIIRRFEASASPRVRLYFARPPYGKLEKRTVTWQRFMALVLGKDKKPPQPNSLRTPFIMTLRRQKITALDQLLQ